MWLPRTRSGKFRKTYDESHVLTDLEELGIVKLPVYSRRIKQTFPGLNMDKEGSIDVDESEDVKSVKYA